MVPTVPFRRPFEPIRRSIAIDIGLPAADGDGTPFKWMVWAYHGFLKNYNAPSQTNAMVAFRRLGDGEVFEEVLRVLPAAALGLMPIGSVWADRHSECQTVLETRTFEVDHDAGGWHFNSFAEADSSSDGKVPHPRKHSPLNDSANQIQYLEFHLRGRGRLVIPCLEYFTRMYGASHYLRQVLLGYPWENEGDPRNKLYGALRVAATPDAWTIRLRHRLDDRDAIFLAHAKYDPFTTRAAKSPYAQLESAFEKRTNPPRPKSIQVGPWHQGKARIEVQGLPFDKRSSFVGLRITGCSVPEGPGIHADRDNSNLAKHAAVSLGQGKAWRSAKEKASESTELTGKDEPDHGSGHVDVASPHMVLIGSDRPVVKVVADQVESSAGGAPGNRSGAGGTLSSGDAHGAGKGIAHASIRTARLHASESVIGAMWKAALSLSERYPEAVSMVQWYTRDTGYRTTPDPRLVGVSEFESETPGTASITRSVREWPLLVVAERLQRGVLVMRLSVLGRSIHVMEIQRRPIDPAADESAKSEAFCGLVLRLDDDGDLDAWLSDFLSVLRYRKGVIHHVLQDIGVPGDAAWFSHRFGRDEKTIGQQALLNGLRKLGHVLNDT